MVLYLFLIYFPSHRYILSTNEKNEIIQHIFKASFTYSKLSKKIAKKEYRILVWLRHHCCINILLDTGWADFYIKWTKTILKYKVFRTRLIRWHYWFIICLIVKVYIVILLIHRISTKPIIFQCLRSCLLFTSAQSMVIKRRIQWYNVVYALICYHQLI